MWRILHVKMCVFSHHKTFRLGNVSRPAVAAGKHPCKLLQGRPVSKSPNSEPREAQAGSDLTPDSLAINRSLLSLLGEPGDKRQHKGLLEKTSRSSGPRAAPTIRCGGSPSGR